MGKRWTWVAGGMLAVFVVSMVFTTILSVASGTFQEDPASWIVVVFGFGAFMVVGALAVAHRPGNAIGWVFSAVGLLPITGALAAEYATYALVTRPGIAGPPPVDEAGASLTRATGPGAQEYRSERSSGAGMPACSYVGQLVMRRIRPSQFPPTSYA